MTIATNEVEQYQCRPEDNDTVIACFMVVLIVLVMHV